MPKKIDYKEKFLLSDVQIDLLMTTHQKMIRAGLIQMGISGEMREQMLNGSAVSFEEMIQDVQKRLMEKVKMAEMREDILLNSSNRTKKDGKHN